VKKRVNKYQFKHGNEIENENHERETKKNEEKPREGVTVNTNLELFETEGGGDS
jgi:hypothetical protein